jgi:pilus assembly protein CpaE
VQLVLQRLCQTGALKQDHGTLIAVLAPTAGSGGTTVASNLAGSLAKNKLWSVGLVDLSHWPGDLALLLNLEPRHTIQDVCQSWQKLDVVGLKSSLVSHATGVNLLSNGLSQTRNESLCPLAIRRILVLSRVTFDFTVLALDHRIGPEELEAMRLSDTVVLVVRPDVPAVRRAKWAKDKAVEGGVSPERLRLVINRWGQRGQLRLDHIETSLKMKAIQLIPDDPARVNTAINEGKLLQELAARATITRRFAALATALNRSVSDNGLGITSSFSRTVRILKNAFRDQNRSDRPRKTRR